MVSRGMVCYGKLWYGMVLRITPDETNRQRVASYPKLNSTVNVSCIADNRSRNKAKNSSPPFLVTFFINHIPRAFPHEEQLRTEISQEESRKDDIGNAVSTS